MGCTPDPNDQKSFTELKLLFWKLSQKMLMSMFIRYAYSYKFHFWDLKLKIGQNTTPGSEQLRILQKYMRNSQFLRFS